MNWILDHTFIGNDASGDMVGWRTDAETLRLLRQYAADKSRLSSSETMFSFIFHAGLAAGRIVLQEKD